MSKPETTPLRIEELPKDDRPRERLVQVGAEGLTNAELLAILLGSGSEGKNAIRLSEELLQELGGFRGIHQADISQLLSFKGIGLAKIARIKAAVEIANRLEKEKRQGPVVLRTPEEVARLVGHELRGKQQEELWVLCLNVRSRLIACEKLYKGSQSGATVRVNEIFTRAIRRGAYAIILVHNHPSGEADASPEDVNLTRIILEAGQLLEIKVQDHLVIGQEGFYSIRRGHPALWNSA